MSNKAGRILTAALLILAVVALILSGGRAEALPSVRAEGGLRLSPAPQDGLKMAWIRVDVVPDAAQDDALWAEVWVPWPPSTIQDLMLFDGYRLIHGAWTVNEDGHITTVWRMEDIKRLDGTVGIYLMAVFD